MSKFLNKKKLLVGVIAALITCQSAIASNWIELNIASKHSNDQYYDSDTHSYKDYNQSNIGAGIMFKMNNHVELGGGFYENSFYKRSVYAGADFHTNSNLPFRLGVSTARVTGYEDHKFLVLPNITAGNKYTRAKIGYLPSIGDKSGLITFTIGIAI